MKFFLLIVISTFFVITGVAQNKETRRDKNDCDEWKMTLLASGSLTTVPLEELLSHPKCYENKIVRTYGIVRYGPEMVELSCPNCLTADVTWFGYRNVYERCTIPAVKSEMKSAAKERGSNTGVVAVGKLGAQGGYGHMNAYQFQFTIICVDEASVLVKSGMLPEAMNEKDRKRISDWYQKAAKQKL